MGNPPEAAIAKFREGFRLRLIERLVLQTALIARVSSLGLSVEKAQTGLKEWLDKNSSVTDEVLGEYSHDPGIVALFGDEVHELVEELKTIVDALAADARTST